VKGLLLGRLQPVTRIEFGRGPRTCATIGTAQLLNVPLHSSLEGSRYICQSCLSSPSGNSRVAVAAFNNFWVQQNIANYNIYDTLSAMDTEIGSL
jgi:hypothetical protein